MSTTTAPIQHDDIVLSQTAREALADRIHFDSVGDRISHAVGVEEFLAELQAAQALVPIVRAGQSGRLPRSVVAEAVAAVEASRLDYAEAVEYERAGLRGYLAGERGEGFGQETREENVAMYRSNEAFVADRLAACETFLTEATA